MQTSQTTLSECEIAQAWAQITVKLWRKNLDRMKVSKGSSGELYRSFQYKVIAASGGNVLTGLNLPSSITASSWIWVPEKAPG